MLLVHTPTHDETVLQPLVSDEQVRERVDALIGKANQRQLWMLFLDEDGVQLPLLIPIDGLPARPTDEDTARVLDRVREVMVEIGAEFLVVVIERYASKTLTVHDRDWARSIAAACSATGIRLRAQLVSHRAGVSLLSAADFGAEPL